MNRVAGRQVLGSAPAIRTDAAPRSPRRRRTAALAALVVTAIVAFGLHVAQIDVV